MFNKSIFLLLFFNAVTALDVPLEQPLEATTPGRIPSLTLLSASYIAKNVVAYKDALIAAGNRDIVDLVVQCTPLPRAQQLTLFRDCQKNYTLTDDPIDHMQITADRIVTMRSGDTFFYTQDGTIIPSLYRCEQPDNRGDRFPGDNHRDASRSRYHHGTQCRSDSTHSIVSSCGTYLITRNDTKGLYTSEICVFDLITGKHLRKFEVAVDKNPILVMNKKYLAFKANRDLAHLIALEGVQDDNPKERYKAILHKEPITHLVTNQDGTRIVTVTHDKRIHIWNDTGLGCGTRINKIKLNEACGDIAFSPDGTQFACAAGNTLLLFDATGKQLHNFGIRTWPWQKTDYSHKVFLKLFFSQDNKRLIASSTINNEQYFINIFDIVTNHEIAELEGQDSSFGLNLRQWHDKIIATNYDVSTIYTDAATKLFDIKRDPLQFEQDLKIVDNHTLLLRNKDKSYTVQSHDGTRQQQFPSHFKAPAVSSNGSTIAFVTGPDEVEVHKVIPACDVSAQEELVKFVNKS